MKLLSVLFIITLLLTNAQESPELKEAADLTESVTKLFKEQKFEEALPLAKRALEIREIQLPRGDQRILTSLGYLSDVYSALRKFDNARKTLERLLAMQEERLGPTALDLAATLDRLALLYNSDDNVDKAEEMYQRALAIREKEYGPDDIKNAKALFSLAQFYRKREQYDKALSFYKRTLSIYGRVSGVNSPEFEHASNAFGCLAYVSRNKEVFEELNDIRNRFAPGLPRIEPADVLNGTALELPRPDYPVIARERRLFGKVIVLVVVDETGKVVSASDMCQGPPHLTEAAIRAAWRSRFSPVKGSGPLQRRGIIQYDFRRY